MRPFRARHILLFIWASIGALALLSLLYPENDIRVSDSLTLRWPALGDVLNPQPKSSAIDSLLQLAPLDSAEISEQLSDIVAEPTAATEPIPTHFVDTFTETGNPLEHFYASLTQTNSRYIHVVHFGDSQIEEDRISMVLRRHLQARYGGGGVGLIPLHQTIPSLTVKQTLRINDKVQTTQQGPKRYLVYGIKANRRPAGNNLYGPMGQVAVMSDSLVRGSEHVQLTIEPNANLTLPESHFTSIRLLADSAVSMSLQGDSTHQQRLQFSDSTTNVTLDIRGRGDVYGLLLETPTGITVDNIPMRGCLGTVFTNINAEQMSAFFRTTHTSLIIMQFGGNAIPFNKEPSTIRGIASQLRTQVQYMRRCAPGASILFIGPSDMLINDEGELRTNPLVPYLDHLLKKMAAEEGIAYWSLYGAMGGENSMLVWQQRGLAGQDGIHFTRRGAERAAEMLWQWLEEGLEQQ